MIVLDTNVLSEMMKPAPERNPGVIAWIDAMPRKNVFTTSVTIAELLVGIRLLDKGKRRSALQAAFDRIAATVFPGRILPFDEDAAHVFPDIVIDRRRRGRSIKLPDLQILAIAKSRSMAVVTRNVSDFSGAGVEIIDPWTVSSAP